MTTAAPQMIDLLTDLILTTNNAQFFFAPPPCIDIDASSNRTHKNGVQNDTSRKTIHFPHWHTNDDHEQSPPNQTTNTHTKTTLPPMHINLDELANHIWQLPNTLATFAHPNAMPTPQMLTPATMATNNQSPIWMTHTPTQIATPLMQLTSMQWMTAFKDLTLLPQGRQYAIDDANVAVDAKDFHHHNLPATITPNMHQLPHPPTFAKHILMTHHNNAPTHWIWDFFAPVLWP